MSDVEEGSPLEELQARHRKEKKELKEKCNTMKKLAKCGNKQKQKETNAEIETLEKSIEARHANEIEELKSSLEKTAINEPVVTTEEKSAKSTEENDETSFYKVGGISNKKQKKQAKKNEAANRLQAAIEEDRENALTSLRTTENTALINILNERGLQLVDIAPDGDCLYNSLAHQLGTKVTGKDVRRRAARYILDNRTDFSPFLTMDDGKPLDDFEFDAYCDKVGKEAKDGGAWGGEPELNAISKSFERKIEVIQPEGSCITYGDAYPTRSLIIVYQRHAYNLGEHYNSTEPMKVT